jgi:hypothetical protein
MQNKYARVGETITWIVATLVIIVVLIFSILITTLYVGKNKGVEFFEQSDTLASKSMFSYLLTKDSEEKTVYEQLEDEENLNDFNGNLALNIFEEIYGEEYSDVWLGVMRHKHPFLDFPNDYFGKVDIERSLSPQETYTREHLLDRIQLNEIKSVYLVLFN